MAEVGPIKGECVGNVKLHRSVRELVHQDFCRLFSSIKTRNSETEYSHNDRNNPVHLVCKEINND